MVVGPAFHPFLHGLGRVVDLFSPFKNKGVCRTFIDADATSDASVRFEHGHLPFFVLGLGGVLKPQGFHGTSLDAQTACFASLRGSSHPVIGFVVAFVMFKDMKGLKKQAAAFAAVAYGVGPLLPVGDGMNQAGVRCHGQDFFGLFLGDLSAQAVFHNIMTQPAKM